MKMQLKCCKSSMNVGDSEEEDLEMKDKNQTLDPLWLDWRDMELWWVTELTAYFRGLLASTHTSMTGEKYLNTTQRGRCERWNWPSGVNTCWTQQEDGDVWTFGGNSPHPALTVGKSKVLTDIVTTAEEFPKEEEIKMQID